MKKVTLILVMMVASHFTFAQTKKASSNLSYRVGLVTTVPMDIYQDNYHVGLGSTLFEVGYKMSPKATLTLNSGYIRMSATDKPSFAQIPLLGGIRYPLSPTFYIGAAAGISFYNKKEYGSTNFMYTPYIGFQIKHISVDLNYLNTVKTNDALKTLSLTVSYSL